MKLSVVATMYRSAPYIEPFHARITAALDKMGVEREIVLVNDGSPDDSLAIAKALADRDPAVRVVDLSRNFGHHKAIITGLDHAQGDMVFLIDIDMEEDPELVAEFFEEWKRLEGRADVIYGVMREREGNAFRRFAGAAFYKLFTHLTGVALPERFTMTRLMTRRYVDALRAFKEHSVFIGGLFVIAGFAQAPYMVRRRYKGSSTYSLARKATLTANAIASFSSKPLLYLFGLGLSVLGASFLMLIWLIVNYVSHNQIMTGWTSLMFSLWFLGGAIILILGLIGFYLAKIFEEAKNRPYSIVREVYGARPSGDDPKA